MKVIYRGLGSMICFCFVFGSESIQHFDLFLSNKILLLREKRRGEEALCPNERCILVNMEQPRFSLSMTTPR
jgi:hypothetical protein